jgi:hypothetical protein
LRGPVEPALYAVIYRTDSQATHAAVTSLEPVVTTAGPGEFQVLTIEQDPGMGIDLKSVVLV